MGRPQLFTRNGHDLGEVVSALQKAIRRGQEEDALYWATELDQSGFGEYAWKRLRIITSEDVGIAEPTLPAQIRALYENWTDLRRKKEAAHPERLFLVHAVLLLARARKSRIVDHALLHFYNDPPPRQVPDVALDKHTLTGKRMGRGWDHFFAEGTLLADPETGELNEGCLDDPYRQRAREALQR